MAATLELEHRECESNPAHFIFSHLLTEDPQDLEQTYKPFPDYPYLRLVLDFIRTCRLLAIEKSRQVMVTWICAAYCLWLALFHSGVKIFIQSQKQEDANAVLDKIMVLYRSMPDWLQVRHPVKHTQDLIRTTTRSSIQAIPQGPDQIRGQTPTLIWSDETSSQTECADTWKAIRPALSKFGAALFTSSAKPGWFKMLTDDKLEGGRPPPPFDQRRLCEGLEHRKLAVNQFTVLKLHYTADPMKRSPEWLAAAKAGMTEPDWQQEMEINYDAKAGQPALPLFTAYRHHIVETPFEIPPDWPIWFSCDYGTRSPSSIHEYTEAPDGTVHAVWEYYSPGTVFDFIDALKAHPHFLRAQAIILDSACWKADQNEATSHQLRSVVDYMEDEGVFPIKAAKVSDATKIAAWDYVWLPLNSQKPPLLKIFVSCPNLIREIPGIVWAEYTEIQQRTRNTRETLVDRDNHAFDDCSYFLLHRYEGMAPKVPDPFRGDIHAMAAEASRQARLDDEARCIAELEERRETTGFYFGSDE